MREKVVGGRMQNVRWVAVGVYVAVVGCGLELEAEGSQAALTVESPRCEIRGLGVVGTESPAVFSGHILSGDEETVGHWAHWNSERFALAEPDAAFCRINGAVLADASGPARVDGESGFTFRLRVQDRSAPGDDELVEGSEAAQTLSATRLYLPRRVEVDDLVVDGDFARLELPEVLEVSEGRAGWGRAVIRLWREDEGPARCIYRGRGRDFHFVRCQGAHPLPEPGTPITVRRLRLRVVAGAPWRGPTTVTWSPVVTAVELIARPADFYRFTIVDADGVVVWSDEGDVVHGDISVGLPD